MQITHHTNGNGLIEFSAVAETPVKDVNVYVHDSGMFAVHDYSCPVCREKHAIIDLSCGIMQPCRACEKLGYRVVKCDGWWTRFFHR